MRKKQSVKIQNKTKYDLQKRKVKSQIACHVNKCIATKSTEIQFTDFFAIATNSMNLRQKQQGKSLALSEYLSSCDNTRT